MLAEHGDELLNGEIFTTVKKAKALVENGAWNITRSDHATRCITAL
jgi:hypothetical protein